MDKTIELDDELVRETQEATGEKTERQAVERVVLRAVHRRRAASTPICSISSGRFVSATTTIRGRSGSLAIEMLIDTTILVDVLRDASGVSAERLRHAAWGGRKSCFRSFTELEVLMGARDDAEWDRIAALLSGEVIARSRTRSHGATQQGSISTDASNGPRTVRSTCRLLHRRQIAHRARSDAPSQRSRTTRPGRHVCGL